MQTLDDVPSIKVYVQIVNAMQQHQKFIFLLPWFSLKVLHSAIIP